MAVAQEMRRAAGPVDDLAGNDLTDGGFVFNNMLNMDALSQTFSALADPTRRAILARLATGAATVGELAEPFDMSLPAVSRHLKVLTDAGLIERHTEAQWRRCELRGEGLRAAADWIESTAASGNSSSTGWTLSSSAPRRPRSRKAERKGDARKRRS